MALPAGAVAAGFRFPTVSKKLGVPPKIGRTHGAAPKGLRIKDDVADGDGQRDQAGPPPRCRARRPGAGGVAHASTG